MHNWIQRGIWMEKINITRKGVVREMLYERVNFPCPTPVPWPGIAPLWREHPSKCIPPLCPSPSSLDCLSLAAVPWDFPSVPHQRGSHLLMLVIHFKRLEIIGLLRAANALPFCLVDSNVVSSRSVEILLHWRCLLTMFIVSVSGMKTTMRLFFF